MFTGLVESLAEVTAVVAEPPGVRLTVRDPAIAAEAQQGESIAVNGCCLTAVEIRDGQISFQAGPETLARTTLGRLTAGSMVNLERSLRVGDRLGGHFVTGHVDAVGTLLERQDEQDWSTFWFDFPAGLSRQMASKGSVAVDGVSLTLVEVSDERFSVALIPHTLQMTTLGALRVGDPVNLETDLLAKYVQQQFQGDR
jgi:riboflavin synthase